MICVSIPCIHDISILSNGSANLLTSHATVQLFFNDQKNISAKVLLRSNTTCARLSRETKMGGKQSVYERSATLDYVKLTSEQRIMIKNAWSDIENNPQFYGNAFFSRWQSEF